MHPEQPYNLDACIRSMTPIWQIMYSVHWQKYIVRNILTYRSVRIGNEIIGIRECGSTATIYKGDLHSTFRCASDNMEHRNDRLIRMNRQAIARSKHGNTCAACGFHKDRGANLCEFCLNKLPSELRQDVAAYPLGDDFVLVFHKCLDFLGVNKPYYADEEPRKSK